MNKKTNKKFTKGFTLLELLVVVLIIGILASIALPQYRKVKVKAEANTMLVNLKALAEAQHRYYLANDRYADKFSDLDIDFSEYPNHNCPKYKPYFYISDCLSNDKSALWISSKEGAMFNNGKYLYSGFIHDHNKIVCFYNASLGTNNLCTKIFNCTLYKTVGSDNYYNCPEL